MTPYIFLFHTPYGPQVRRFSTDSAFRAYCAQMRTQLRRVAKLSPCLAAGIDLVEYRK